MADSAADAAPSAGPAQVAEEPPVSGDFSLVPLNAEEYADKCLPLVPELRTRLAASLPEGAVLWGAELLNPEDEASTHVLAKFLRSRDLDVDKAATMVASTLAWRKAYGTDAIAADNSVPECLLTIARLWGRARSGHQVLWFEYAPLAGQAAWDAAFHHGKVGDGPLIRSRVKLLEAGIANFEFARGLGAPNAFVLVHDLREAPLAGVLVSSDASSGIIQMVKIANEYYPDMSVKHVLLYPPTLMSGILLMLKPFLSSRTQRKLLWAPHGQELLTLLQLMPLSAIPARHGGFGGLGPPAGEVQEADVAAGREHSVALRTMGSGEQAHWLVSVTDRTCGLRVEFVPLGGEKRGGVTLVQELTIVVGDSSVDACTGAVEGSYVASSAGHVRLIFDNSASWVTAKHVFYAAGVRTVPLPVAGGAADAAGQPGGEAAAPADGTGGPTLFSTIAATADAPAAGGAPDATAGGM